MASRTPQFNAAATLEAACSIALADLVGALDPEYLRQQRWFGSKTKPITRLRLKDHAVIQGELPYFLLALIEVDYAKFDPELYSVPLMITDRAVPQQDLLLELKTASEVGFLYEALANDDFCRLLLQKIAHPGAIPAAHGSFVFEKTHAFIRPEASTVTRSRAEQSNTSIIFGDALILKNFRKVEPGTNPDLEISRFLTTKTDFAHIPLLAGTIEYFSEYAALDSHAAIALLQRFVPNEGNAWEYTLRHLEDFYAAAARSPKAQSQLDTSEDPAAELIRDYAAEASRLGHITGRLHLALASDPRDPEFAPEAIGVQDVQRWVTATVEHVESVFRALARGLSSYDPKVQTTARELIRKKAAYLKKVEELRELEASQTCKIRCHGDYHLGQVLKTADGFCILDFEGEPLRSLRERREKASALKDVAGMMRSYHYAAYAGLFAFAERHDGERDLLDPWARAWERQASQSFLTGYLAETRLAPAAFVPSSLELLTRVLSVFLLDKAVYELNYELNHRPSWLKIPLEGIRVAMELH